MNRPLSDKDILQAVGRDKIRVVLYHELEKMNSIDELFNGLPMVALLYNSEKQIGHWVLLIRRGKTTIEHYDSYRKPVDDSFIQREGKVDLTRILYNSGVKKVVFNHRKMQKLAKDIATCGRHLIVRALLYRTPLKSYLKEIKETGIDPDKLVYGITRHLLGY